MFGMIDGLISVFFVKTINDKQHWRINDVASMYLALNINFDALRILRKNKPSISDCNVSRACSIKMDSFLFNIQAMLLLLIVFIDSKSPKTIKIRI